MLRSLSSSLASLPRSHRARTTTLAALAAIGLLPSSIRLAPRLHAQDDPFAAHVRPTDPLTPAEEQATFRVPEGFRIDLFAAEPEIAKPLNMAFDSRGRLWVTSTIEYPYPAPATREGRDTITILEDTDGDGRADEHRVFATGLNVPIGLYPLEDGCVVFSIPHIWKLTDHDGDDVADERTRLYGPMGWERDTHGMNNGFRRGLDGWMYACHGFNNQTQVRGTDGATLEMQSGNTYRYRLDGSHIEIHTRGQVNPFGMAVDEFGHLYTSDCHSKPIYQLIRGAYYPSFGKPHDGMGFGPELMRHQHGSTAICGVAYYDADQFPPEYRGDLFVGNVMTSRVNHDRVEWEGGSPTAVEQPDFVATSDPWFRPVDIRVGPDGAMYIADFYNRIIGHYEVPLDHPGRDRTSGRIWRVTWAGESARPAARPAPLAGASAAELVAALGHPSLDWRTRATHLLAERSDDRSLELALEAQGSAAEPLARAHAIWVVLRRAPAHPSATEMLARAATDASPVVRAHAMRALVLASGAREATRALAVLGLHDESGIVRRAAVGALAELPDARNVAPILALLERTPTDDDHLTHAARLALRAQLRADGALAALPPGEVRDDSLAEGMAGICLGISSAESAEWLLAYLESGRAPPARVPELAAHAVRHAPPARLDGCIGWIRARFEDDVDRQLELFDAIEAQLAARAAPSTTATRAWAESLARALLDAADEADAAWTSLPHPSAARADHPWTLERRDSADGDRGSAFIGSLPRGETLTGVLRSEPFEIPERLRFFLAGHDGYPDKPALEANFVRLRAADSNETLRLARAPRHDTAREVSWDLREHAGSQGVLEVVDGDTEGAYAWIAFGRLEPSVAPIAGGDPVRVARLRTGAADLSRKHGIAALTPRLVAIAEDAELSSDVRIAAARATVSFAPDPRLDALVPLLGEGDAPAELTARIVALLTSRDDAEIDAALAEAVRSTPRRTQSRLAATLASTRAGAETLLDLVEKGLAAKRLLTRPAIRDAVVAAGVDDAEERLEELAQDLPEDDAERARVIADRLAGFRRQGGRVESGHGVFRETCASCHKIGEEGAVVGPQLDGIGTRGVERLIEDILDPNRNVDVSFIATTFVTRQGQVLSGLVRADEAGAYRIVDPAGEEKTLAKRDVLQATASGRSLMPDNFAESLTEEAFRDLLAFLAALKPEA